MRRVVTTISTAAVLAAVAGCAPGRYTGGGNLMPSDNAAPQGQQLTCQGTFTLNNVSAADCHNSGYADTFRGIATWTSATGESFTCKVSPDVYNVYSSGGGSGTVQSGGATSGSFAGYITAAAGNLNGAGVGSYCYITATQTAPTAPWYLTLTAGDQYTYQRIGVVAHGNTTFHSENTQGVCSSATPGKSK